MAANQGDIQERIAAARREAESLKEKIRAKKESSADTSCESLSTDLILKTLLEMVADLSSGDVS